MMLKYFNRLELYVVLILLGFAGLPADLDEKVGEKEDHNFGKSRRKVGVWG